MARILNDTPQRGAQPAPDTPVSVISRGLRIQGRCEVPGRLVVEGHITGDVRAVHIEVVADGRVDGNVTGPDGHAPAGTVLVAGRVGGKVAAERVEVHDNGEVGGGVVTTDAIVRGRVSGGLQAGGRVTLTATGFVEGDIRARRLIVEEGGQVNGNIRMGDPAS
jgi:cytoskeletal protein CcmA (bactofilin family)